MPTADAAALRGSCGDRDSGQVPKLDLRLARRAFLNRSGILMGTIAAGSVLAALAPLPVWAVEPKTLTQSDGETLIKMGRTLDPHKKLSDAVHALLAKDLDAKASGDAAVATQLRDGVAVFDEAAGGSFAAARDKKMVAIVKSMEGQAFFATVRGQCVTSVYVNDMAYTTFGYLRSLLAKSGYIARGFQDLKRLPAPSTAAIPKPCFG